MDEKAQPSPTLRRWPLFGFDGPTALYRHLTRAGMDVSARTIEYWAAGRRTPYLATLAGLREALELSPEEILLLDRDLSALVPPAQKRGQVARAVRERVERAASRKRSR